MTPLLASWLRRVSTTPGADTWTLRGSVVTAALCPGARTPVDVDHLASESATLDLAHLETLARTVAAGPDPAGSSDDLVVESAEVIWANTPTPGLRLRVRSNTDELQIDLGVGDPMVVPPRPLLLPDVGPVRACAPETLFGWKLHGLCEHGRGRWRVKDLVDLDLLSRHASLEPTALRAAVDLAFSSRDLSLDALDDFRRRDTWGCSPGRTRRWRTYVSTHPVPDDFLTVRARVRAAVDAIVRD